MEDVMVLSILMQAVGPDILQMIAEPVKMLIEECFKEAAIINADTSHPFVMLCGPDTSVPTDGV